MKIIIMVFCISFLISGCTIPNSDVVTEEEVMEQSKINLESLTTMNETYNYERNYFRKEIVNILNFLKNKDGIPIYENVGDSFKSSHLKVINEAFDDYCKSIISNDTGDTEIYQEVEPIFAILMIESIAQPVWNTNENAVYYQMYFYQSFPYKGGYIELNALTSPSDGINRYVIGLVESNNEWVVHYFGKDC